MNSLIIFIKMIFLLTVLLWLVPLLSGATTEELKQFSYFYILVIFGTTVLVGFIEFYDRVAWRWMK